MIGTPDSEVVSGSLRSAREHHLDHEMLDAAQIRRRFPAVHAGARDRRAATRTKPASCFPRKRSARISTSRSTTARTCTSTSEWRSGSVASSGRIDVRTSRGRYEADRLILAPGAWASQLFKIDWLPLEVEPQQLHWFEPARRRRAVRADRFPIYIWDLGNGIQFYGFPADDEGRVKVAFFRSKVKGEDAIRAALRPCLPALADGVLRRDRQLQVHADARSSFRDRASSGSRERRDRVAVLGPRLQVRERDRRDPRRPGDRWSDASPHRPVCARTL